MTHLLGIAQHLLSIASGSDKPGFPFFWLEQIHMLDILISALILLSLL